MVGDMTYEKIGARSIDYMPWRCPGSRLVFRGPRRRLDGEFIAFLGGLETYGKFIERPFPSLLEERLGIACVNLGWPNAGVDVFLNEPAVLDICARARAVVVQLPCAQNMSNRFYSVHPRRNDRFIGPTALMRSIFPEVDFTEFHFTRHMLRHVGQSAPDRIGLIRDELQRLWVVRMRQLLGSIGGRATLLRLSEGSQCADEGRGDPMTDAAFVTSQMIHAIADHAGPAVTVTMGAAAHRTGNAGMVFSELESAAAALLPGPSAHRQAARALYPVLRQYAR